MSDNLRGWSATCDESTCHKRVTVCEIFDQHGTMLARESNRCNPEGGSCHRMTTSNTREAYPKDSECNWTHAEIMAINALSASARPYSAFVYGHDFPCPSCEAALRARGVALIECISGRQGVGVRSEPYTPPNEPPVPLTEDSVSDSLDA